MRMTTQSSVDIEVIRAGFFLFFFYKRYFKHLKHKQKHLTNIQPNISISKKSLSTNIQPNICKCKKKAPKQYLFKQIST